MATEWGNELAYDEYFATSHQVALKEQQAKHLKAEAEFRRLKALKGMCKIRKVKQNLHISRTLIFVFIFRC